MGEQEKQPRPNFIKTVCVMTVLYAVGALVAMLILSPDYSNAIEGAFGVCRNAFLVSAGFMALVALVSVVGLWDGDKWGWWLCGFYWSARLVNVLGTLPGYWGHAATGATLSPIRFITALIWALAILVILFRKEIYVYVRMDRQSRWVSAGILLIAATVYPFAIQAATLGLCD